MNIYTHLVWSFMAYNQLTSFVWQICIELLQVFPTTIPKVTCGFPIANWFQGTCSLVKYMAISILFHHIDLPNFFVTCYYFRMQ
jgi:hypothetical protein